MAQMDIRTRQEIEQIIAVMLARYAQLEDARNWDQLAAMYTEDGRLVMPDNPADAIEGRAALRAALMARKARTTRHIVTNILVDVQHPARLSAQSTVLRFTGAATAPSEEAPPAMDPGCPVVMTFDDLIVMEPAGYRFAERRGRFDFAP